MRVDILTLFPGMFTGPMGESMVWKAREIGALDLRLHDIRAWGIGPRRVVDDTPYGGGGGMVMRSDVLVSAIEGVAADAAPAAPPPPVIFMSPHGRVFSHAIALELAALPRFVLVCGHYEGIDERVRRLAITDEISIGDYVLTGGELAAMVVVDAVIRHLPGVLGAEGGADRDSHAHGVLEGPQYTRPPEFRGLAVPAPLLGGDHSRIARWRRREGLRETWRRRPDLLMRPTLRLTDEERGWLAEFADEDARDSARAADTTTRTTTDTAPR
jgi:tRNA (guanine37-N1)-methyltransferase